MRYVPLSGILALCVVGGVWRAWLQRRLHGTWGVSLFRAGLSGTARDVLLVVLGLLIAGQAAVLALWPETVERRLVTRPHDLAGAALLLAGIAVVVRAQLDLGASWRVGIDRAARPGLVVRGLYVLSRNPIFLGLLVAVAGVTLLTPTWLSVATLASSVLAIRSQVLEEEAYLRQTYEAEYLAYASKVGRFVPWLGRLEAP